MAKYNTMNILFFPGVKTPVHSAGVLPVLVLFVLIIAGANSVRAADAPELRAVSDILPADYHRSNYYRINDVTVNNNNYLFTVESDYGNFRIESVGLTLKYLQETETVGQVLNQIPATVSENQVDLKSQLRIRAESAIDILASPLGTAGNLAGQLARNLGDTLAGDSPYVIYGRSYAGGDEHDPNLDIHKRNISNQLGLDVYSSNGIVQHMLMQLARNRSAGNISSGAVLINVDDHYRKKVANGKLQKEINNVIRGRTVRELYEYNRNLLGRIGIPEDVVDSFLNHPAYSPSLQTTIIKHMDYLYGVDNYRDFLSLSLLATDEVTAFAFARILEMLAWYSDNIDVIASIRLTGKTVSGITTGEEQIAFYPDDLFYMDEDKTLLLDTLAARAEVNGYHKVRLVSYGTISSLAKTGLLERDMDYMEEFLFK